MVKPQFLRMLAPPAEKKHMHRGQSLPETSGKQRGASEKAARVLKAFIARRCRNQAHLPIVCPFSSPSDKSLLSIYYMPVPGTDGRIG